MNIPAAIKLSLLWYEVVVERRGGLVDKVKYTVYTSPTT